jgi:hypothetical protein
VQWWSVARSGEGRPGGRAAQGKAASGEATRSGQLCSAAARKGKRERRGGKGARSAQRRGQVRQLLWSRQWGGGGGRALGVELCSALCCACRGSEGRRRKRKREKVKGKRGTGEKGKEGGASAEFAATVASAGLSTWHGAWVEERMAVNFGCQMTKRREMFWAIGSSDGKGLGAICA